MPRLVFSCFVIVLLVPAAAARAQVPPYTESVTVARVAIDAHVLHDDGRPVLGLGPEHFKVLVDGRETKVLAAEWTTGAVADRLRERVTAQRPADEPSVTRGEPDRSGLPRGRQIILLIQRDLEPTRLEGLVGLLRRARAFVAGLGPDDRVAVVSFESHLSLWTDFTADRRAVDALLERRVLMGAPPAAVPSSDLPSLAVSFDRRAAARAASMEQALLTLARALSHVPGAKSLVVFGHGFGRLGLPGLGGTPNTMGFDREYGEARQLFLAGRTAVYCLDTTRAASHSLETGLRQVAADTGGFYLSTDEFADAAMRRLGDALTGRYELSIETPALPAGEHRITVTLVGTKGIVLARRSYVG
jgi:VWFA-related protein